MINSFIECGLVIILAFKLGRYLYSLYGISGLTKSYYFQGNLPKGDNILCVMAKSTLPERLGHCRDYLNVNSLHPSAFLSTGVTFKDATT